MEALLLGLLITAGISIPISYVLEIKNACRIVKDVANMGYKINMEKMKEMPNDKEQVKKLFGKILLIPFFNLLVAYKHIEEYNNQFNLILNQYDTFGVLEKMSSFEKEYYEKNPTTLTAMNISVGLSKFFAFKGYTTGAITDKETNSEIEFAIGKDVKEMAILKATGIYEKMTLEEQRKEVAKTYIDMYDEATEQYGSYENFLKEVENDPSKANLDISKNEESSERNLAEEKAKLEATKEEVLKLQGIYNLSEKEEKPKIKRK